MSDSQLNYEIKVDSGDVDKAAAALSNFMRAIRDLGLEVPKIKVVGQDGAQSFNTLNNAISKFYGELVNAKGATNQAVNELLSDLGRLTSGAASAGNAAQNAGQKISQEMQRAAVQSRQHIDNLVQGLGLLGSSFGGAGGQATQLAYGITNLTRALPAQATVFAVGAAAVGVFGLALANAAKEYQHTVDLLQAELKSQGMGTQFETVLTSLKSLEPQAKIVKATFEDLSGSFNLLNEHTHNSAQTMDLVTTAIKVSDVEHKTYKETITAIRDALEGEMGGMRALGITIDETTAQYIKHLDQAERTKLITQELHDRFDKLPSSIDDTKTSIAELQTKMTEWMRDTGGPLNTMLNDGAKAAMGFGDELNKLAKLFKEFPALPAALAWMGEHGPAGTGAEAGIAVHNTAAMPGSPIGKALEAAGFFGGIASGVGSAASQFGQSAVSDARAHGVTWFPGVVPQQMTPEAQASADQIAGLFTGQVTTGQVAGGINAAAHAIFGSPVPDTVTQAAERAAAMGFTSPGSAPGTGTPLGPGDDAKKTQADQDAQAWKALNEQNKQMEEDAKKANREAAEHERTEASKTRDVRIQSVDDWARNEIQRIKDVEREDLAAETKKKEAEQKRHTDREIAIRKAEDVDKDAITASKKVEDDRHTNEVHHIQEWRTQSEAALKENEIATKNYYTGRKRDEEDDYTSRSNNITNELKQHEEATRKRVDVEREATQHRVRDREESDGDEIKRIETTTRAAVQARETEKTRRLDLIREETQGLEAQHRTEIELLDDRVTKAESAHRRETSTAEEGHRTRVAAIKDEEQVALTSIKNQIEALDREKSARNAAETGQEDQYRFNEARSALAKAKAEGKDPEEIKKLEHDVQQSRLKQADDFLDEQTRLRKNALQDEEQDTRKRSEDETRIEDDALREEKSRSDEELRIVKEREAAKRRELDDTYTINKTALENAAHDEEEAAARETQAMENSAQAQRAQIELNLRTFRDAQNDALQIFINTQQEELTNFQSQKTLERQTLEHDHTDRMRQITDEETRMDQAYALARRIIEQTATKKTQDEGAAHDKAMGDLQEEETKVVRRYQAARDEEGATHTQNMANLNEEEAKIRTKAQSDETAVTTSQRNQKREIEETYKAAVQGIKDTEEEAERKITALERFHDAHKNSANEDIAALQQEQQELGKLIGMMNSWKGIGGLGGAGGTGAGGFQAPEGGYSVNLGPTTSVDTIRRALKGTPMEGMEDYIYQKGIEYGVDPSFAMAVLASDSGFGKSNSYGKPYSQGGNYNPFDMKGGAGSTGEMRGGFAVFPNYEAGIEAFYKLISDPKGRYYGAGNVTTNAIYQAGYATQQDIAGGAITNLNAQYPTYATGRGMASPVYGPLPGGPGTMPSWVLPTGQINLRDPNIMPSQDHPSQGERVDPQNPDKPLGDYQAKAACGPVAAVIFARAYGRNPTLAEAVNIARSGNMWSDPSVVGWENSGMHGAYSERDLMSEMGVQAEVVPGTPDWSRVQASLAAGNPVAFSTPGHYLAATYYDQNKGYYVGQTGLAAAGGSDYMTAADIQRRGVTHTLYGQGLKPGQRGYADDTGPTGDLPPVPGQETAVNQPTPASPIGVGWPFLSAGGVPGSTAATAIASGQPTLPGALLTGGQQYHVIVDNWPTSFGASYAGAGGSIGTLGVGGPGGVPASTSGGPIDAMFYPSGAVAVSGTPTDVNEMIDDIHNRQPNRAAAGPDVNEMLDDVHTPTVQRRGAALGQPAGRGQWPPVRDDWAQGRGAPINSNTWPFITGAMTPAAAPGGLPSPVPAIDGAPAAGVPGTPGTFGPGGAYTPFTTSYYGLTGKKADDSLAQAAVKSINDAIIGYNAYMNRWTDEMRQAQSRRLEAERIMEQNAEKYATDPKLREIDQARLDHENHTIADLETARQKQEQLRDSSVAASEGMIRSVQTMTEALSTAAQKVGEINPPMRPQAQGGQWKPSLGNIWSLLFAPGHGVADDVGQYDWTAKALGLSPTTGTNFGGLPGYVLGEGDVPGRQASGNIDAKSGGIGGRGGTDRQGSTPHDVSPGNPIGPGDVRSVGGRYAAGGYISQPHIGQLDPGDVIFQIDNPSTWQNVYQQAASQGKSSGLDRLGAALATLSYHDPLTDSMASRLRSILQGYGTQGAWAARSVWGSAQNPPAGGLGLHDLLVSGRNLLDELHPEWRVAAESLGSSGRNVGVNVMTPDYPVGVGMNVWEASMLGIINDMTGQPIAPWYLDADGFVKLPKVDGGGGGGAGGAGSPFAGGPSVTYPGFAFQPINIGVPSGGGQVFGGVAPAVPQVSLSVNNVVTVQTGGSTGGSGTFYQEQVTGNGGQVAGSGTVGPRFISPEVVPAPGPSTSVRLATALGPTGVWGPNNQSIRPSNDRFGR
jgi:hypothetical protein